MMQDGQTNIYQTKAAFDAYWSQNTIEKGRGWKQFMRWYEFWEPRLAPSGDWNQLPNIYDASMAMQSASSATGATNLGAGDWSLVGPLNGNSLNGIGRVNAIAFHPDQPNTIFVGAPAGGLWKTTNNGLSWSTNTDLLPNLGVSAIVVDPVHPDTMYIGTGDRDAGDTYTIGVLKSVDGGQSWQTTGMTYALNQYRRITGMVIHPTNTSTLVCATRHGMFRTTDGGANWTLVQGGTFQNVKSVPGAEHLLYAGTYNNARVWYSRDFGLTWTMAGSNLPTSGTVRAEVAVTGADTNYVYAVYGASNNGLYGVYRSTDRGVTWTQMHGSSPNLLDWSTSGSGSGGQAWYDLTIGVSHTNKNLVLVGGVNIWRSTNGGANFSLCGHWYGGGGVDFVHADHHALEFKPGTNTAVVGNDGGVYISNTAGQNGIWNERCDGLAITQYYKISTTIANKDVTLAGAQDNGTHRSNAAGWAKVGGGDGMDNGIAFNNANMMYRSIYYGNFYKSTNGGSNFSALNGLTPSGSGNWVTPFVVSQINSNTLYAGFDKVWKSTNAGTTFSATSGAIWGSVKIDVLAEAPSNANYLYVGLNQRVYRSSNGGSTWTLITGIIADQSNITDIAVDPNDELHIAIAKTGYGANHVYESFDGGNSWYNRTANLPSIPANAIRFEPGSNGILLVGTDIGCYFRSASMTTWEPFMEGLPNVIINDIEFIAGEDIVRVGTYGRGVWQSPVPSEFLDKPVADFVADPGSMCAVGDTVHLVDLSTNLPTQWSWHIYPSTFSYAQNTSDTSRNPIIVPTTSGAYSVQLISGNNSGSDTAVKIQYIHIGGIQTPIAEEFTNGLQSGWVVENPTGGKGWGAVNRGNLDSSSAIMSFYNYADTGAIDNLISPAYQLQANSTLLYDVAYRIAPNTASDTLRIYASTNCGQTWTLLSTRYEDGNGSFATAPANANAFIPSTSSDWRTDTLALGTLNGVVQFKFEAINAGSNLLHLDHIRLDAPVVTTPVADFFHDATACANQPMNFYNVSQGQNLTYSWSFPGGTPSTSTAANPVVTYASSGTYNAQLIATNSAGQNTMLKTNTVSIVSAVAASVNITASTMPVCMGDTVVFTATPVNGGTAPIYQWTVNGQARGTNSPTLALFNASSGDNVKVSMMSNEACATPSHPVSNTIVLSLNALPSVDAGTYSGQCVGGPAFQLSGTPSGGTFSGPGVSQGMFDPGQVGPGAHTVTYVYTDGNGCTNSDQVDIIVSNPPNVALTMPFVRLCPGDPAFNPSGGYPGGGTYAIDGQPITQVVPSSLSVGMHSLEYAYSNGICTVTAIDSFPIHAAPPVPTIQIFDGDSLFCPEADTLIHVIKWYDPSNTVIPGANKPWYHAPTPGDYKVRIRSGLNCLKNSAPATVVSVDEHMPWHVVVSPNPTHGISRLDFNHEVEDVVVKMYDIKGSLILQVYHERTSTVELDLRDLPAGVYMVDLKTATGQQSLRIMRAQD